MTKHQIRCCSQILIHSTLKTKLPSTPSADASQYIPVLIQSNPKQILTTHELHIAGLAYQVLYAVNLQGDTKLRQVKFQLGCLHLPPLNPDPLDAKAQKGVG